jgi:glucosamine-6-phosphate deaminase
MPPMRIEIVADEDALAQRAADIICDVLRAKPRPVLGLPTGETPKRTYAELVRRSGAGEVDASNALGFAVDEFLDVAPAAPGTNRAFFDAYLADTTISIRSPDPASSAGLASEYLNDLKHAGGLDLCILGVGTNGHIAFNEPGSAVDSRARVVNLTIESRRAHAPAFGSLDGVPERGVTLGVGDILESRAILVMAQGEAKAAIVARAIEGPRAAAVPASWLQSHGNVTWLLDEPAASHLSAETRRGAAG